MFPHTTCMCTFNSKQSTSTCNNSNTQKRIDQLWVIKSPQAVFLKTDNNKKTSTIICISSMDTDNNNRLHNRKKHVAASKESREATKIGGHLVTTDTSVTATTNNTTTTIATPPTTTTAASIITNNSRDGSTDGAMQRCGLCSLLSSLLRRAMCVGSRRGSGESYYQELAETTVSLQTISKMHDDNKKHKLNQILWHDQAPEIATMETDGSIYISLIPSKSQQRRVSDTDKDRPLLDALMIDDKLEHPRRRHACTGRFLTMHKRRRKKLATRALLQDTAILDDILHGQVQCILNQVGNWRFNAFTLETVTGGRSLPVLCVHLFHWYGLMEHFNLDVVRLWKLFTLIEEGYHSTNPYHNSIHATDVTQAMHCFLQETKIYQFLEPIEIMASLIGAVTHDLDHPGVNQPFLIATSNHLAALYENTSVLENHHWRSAVGCLLESGVAEQINDIRPQLEKQISSLILATDITRQPEFLKQIREYLDNDTLDMKKSEHRLFILQIALKCADISNPCRPWDISKKWSQKVCEEFFRQGDYERQLNLPVTSLCDRYTMSVPKIQVGFFKFVVTPLFDEWQRFLNSKLSRKMMHFLKYNQLQWENRVAAEMAEETHTEISDAELLEEDEDEIEAHGGKINKGADDYDYDEAAVNSKNNSNNSIKSRNNKNKLKTSTTNEFIDEHGNIIIIDDEPYADISDSSEILLPIKIKLPRRSSLQVPSLRTCKFDRRHSVPVNPPPRIILTTNGSHAEARISHEAIREDMEIKFDHDTFSILSSDSDSYRRGVGGLGRSADNSVVERPLSAETLVPDLSIATMSNNSACADRLNLVMHGAVSLGNTNNLSNMALSKQLIRQQTFPPLHTYIRARYMSATTEMGTCQESLIESSNSTSSESPSIDLENRNVLATKKECVKRSEPADYGQSEKSSKIAKLSIGPGQKENLDPSISRKNLNRRRGSAPVTVAVPNKSTVIVTPTTGNTITATTKIEDTLSLVFKTCDKFMRRGSMPVDVMRMSSNDKPQTDYNLNISVFQRRGSVPCDNLTILNRNNCNGKSSRNRKKLLRRRSSGGAEILSPILAESESGDGDGGGDGNTSGGKSSWYRFKRELSRNRPDMDSLLSRRRGSLPVEVLTVGHSGSIRH